MVFLQLSKICKAISMNLLGNWREIDNSCITPRELQGGVKFISCTISERGQGKTSFLAVHRHKKLEFHEYHLWK
jgi:hypothetical protein